MIKTKKENRVSKRVSIQQNDPAGFIKHFSTNGMEIQSRSVLVSLDVINEGCHEDGVKNVLLPAIKRESCYNHYEKSCMRKKVLKKDVYCEIDMMQKEQLKLRQEIAKFRKETKQKLKQKQSQIESLRQQIELAYNFPCSDNSEQKSHLSLIEEYQRQLYGIEKEVHCLSVYQNQIILDRELAISQLQQEIEKKRAENFERNLDNQILLKRKDELTNRRNQLIHKLQQNQKALLDGDDELARIRAERESNKLIQNSVILFKNYKEYTNEMKLAELEAVYADLIQIVGRNKKFFEEQLESTKLKYEKELVGMRQIIDTSLWWKQRTSHHSVVNMNCLLEEDLMGEFNGSEMNSVWRRMPGRKHTTDFSSYNSGIIGQQSRIMDNKPYMVPQVAQISSEVPSESELSSKIIEASNQEENGSSVMSNHRNSNICLQSNIMKAVKVKQLDEKQNNANSSYWLVLGVSGIIGVCGYLIYARKT